MQYTSWLALSISGVQTGIGDGHGDNQLLIYTSFYVLFLEKLKTNKQTEPNADRGQSEAGLVGPVVKQNAQPKTF